MEWASSAAVVPSASSRCRAVGKTNRDDACHRAPFPAQPGIAPCPDTVRSPSRVLDHPWSRPTRFHRVHPAQPGLPGSDLDAEQARPGATGRPAVASASRACNAAGVSRSSSSAARTASSAGARRHRRARFATAPGEPPQPACPRRYASPSPPGSGAPAGPGAPRRGPTPCRGRRRRRGCRVTWTSSCRRGPTRPTWNHSRTNGLSGHRLGLGRSRTRDAGTRGRALPRGCRSSRRAHAGRAPNTRCASPAAPAPNATPRPARRAATAARARSRAGLACWGPRDDRRARPPARASGSGRTR